MQRQFDTWGVDQRQFWLRGQEPQELVGYDPESRMWNVYGHSEASQVLTDHRTFSSNMMRLMAAEVGADIEEAQAGELLYLDPPRHTRLRRLVNHAFTPKVLASLEPRVAALTNELLDQAAVTDRLELVSALAYPLPVIVIAELLGVPASDRDQFRRWAESLIPSTGDDVNLVGRFEGQNEVTETTLQQRREFADYLASHIEDRRRTPREDLLTGLVHAEVEGERLSDKEIATLADVLLLAGHVTTTMLLGNTILCLDAHPEEFARVRADRSRLPAVIEEALRFVPPFTVTSRVTTVEAEVGGVTIPADQLVMVWLGAANRDPRVFDDPAAFRPGRDPNPHLTFSRGIHYCIGAGLARLEGVIALNILFDRYSVIATLPADPPKFIGSSQMLNAYMMPLAVSS
ncbi:cytochrome P450 [Micromonospora sp. HUAS LYJ1]|uniref:cytochrome P450 n=1 Tax=Micromonospora sp. HUAS LYJ1 TaxID=3061626 RepID=UPI00267292D2|nr:cytochrome P450 [Micromonospora sp. HUAS LYJ1]WKU05548.1 cytochrome P450 [Micromonospora sp. HUAS LYJ1]